MEHRLSPRLPYRSDVAILYDGLGLLRARATDISQHGMFVETGQLLLPQHAFVEVVLPVDEPAAPITPRYPAMVVRVAQNGVGLMFGQMRSNLLENIALRASRTGTA